MNKLYSLIFTLLLAVGLLAACGTSDNQPNETASGNDSESARQEETAFPVTIKDALDKEVVIESKPERIVSLMPSNTEIAFALGLGKEIVGVNDYDNYPKEATKKEKVGGMEFNVEKIISLKPNLVLAHESNNAETGLQQLRDAGIAVLVVNDAKSFEEIFATISMIGKATGEKDAAVELTAEMKERLEKIEAKAQEIKKEDRKSVFVEVQPAPEIYAAGKNTFIDEMLKLINADNIITESDWPKIDQEAVIEKNPDVIITTHGYYTKDPIENVLNRNGWQDINAVKNKQVADVNSDAVTRSGPRIVEGVEELAKAVYPETFK